MLDVSGWSANLDQQSAIVSQRNLHKTTYAFFSFIIESVVPRDLVERMASLASRLSQLCRAMRPYTTALFMCLRNFKDTHTKRHLPSLARVDVCVWRAFLVSCKFDPVNMCRMLYGKCQKIGNPMCYKTSPTQTRAPLPLFTRLTYITIKNYLGRCAIYQLLYYYQIENVFESILYELLRDY
jgi:hypothetical protein